MIVGRCRNPALDVFQGRGSPAESENQVSRNLAARPLQTPAHVFSLEPRWGSPAIIGTLDAAAAGRQHRHGLSGDLLAEFCEPLSEFVGFIATTS